MKRIILFILTLVVQTSHSQNNWLSKIEDSREIANISIPGTHNSATGNKLKYGICLGVTQHLSIEEQWEMGIRAFDLRPDIKDGEMNIYHGALKTRITFPEAIETILDNLETAPDEFAIVIIRQERFGNDATKRELWSKYIGEYIASLGSKAAVFHPQITAGEMRGKILFLSRNDYSHCNKGGYIRGWSHSPKGTNSAAIVSYNNDEQASLAMQDFYAPLNNEKQKEKLQTIISLIEEKRSDELQWSINYLSGYRSTLLGIEGIPSMKGYLKNAEYIHKGTLEYLKEKKHKGGIGIIMMDFAGKEKVKQYQTLGASVVNAIIVSNFQ